jgi:hypothetical protein
MGKGEPVVTRVLNISSLSLTAVAVACSLPDGFSSDDVRLIFIRAQLQSKLGRTIMKPSILGSGIFVARSSPPALRQALNRRVISGAS